MAEQEIKALVYSYLQSTDPKVAETFKKKTGAVSLWLFRPGGDSLTTAFSTTWCSPREVSPSPRGRRRFILTDLSHFRQSYQWDLHLSRMLLSIFKSKTVVFYYSLGFYSSVMGFRTSPSKRRISLEAGQTAKKLKMSESGDSEMGQLFFCKFT